ncbi:fatty acid CoA ligase family protein [Chromatocurvus halotolerans]|uniref:Acyl-CoA synthetase (AMP-forming)/AMP-acid ligase II n=1 Tax=Chromatocurvus halotolerans TaxID=1132028 RepID=A0A4R2KSV7_9GAMM|nr:fatty acid CoA ligase family protein [Chromatocurvus halotolerans]TCO75882.1 acyl-CoA synthetase (AMP-forming)/AMP-acid ligase II [Chromatocurvus halotolerans]
MTAPHPEQGNTGPCNVAAALVEQARRQPQRPAIHYPVGAHRGTVDYHSATYAELDALSDCYARGLKHYGIERGARVALMVPPGLDFFALFFALFKAGIVPVLIDPGIGLKPLKTCLAEAEPEAFIGITRAQLARVILRWSPHSIHRNVTLGPRLGWGGLSLRGLARRGGVTGPPVLADTRAEEIAAILFTSGSTGIPKGVVYRHRHFTAQVDMLRATFGIEPGEVDLATFPPFALFDPALGMTTVVPYMDPTRPARANPDYLAQAIDRFSVTNVFGSPALLKVLGTHCREKQRRLPTLRRVLSAGAAVPADTVSLMQQAMPADGRVYTPYGATECLPVACISSHELSPELIAATREGAGTCVGRPVAPNEVAILRLCDEALETFAADDLLAAGAVGEIIVRGPTTTDRYWQRSEQTRLAKTADTQGRLWHRMGDAGYLDTQGRLWFCGRKSQRVRTAQGDLFADQIEAIFNTLDDVERCALVGVGEAGEQVPVLCVELHRAGSGQPPACRQAVEAAVRSKATGHAALQSLGAVLFHPGFPVDIRHNSKINRQVLAAWAALQCADARRQQQPAITDTNASTEGRRL